jgi:acyl carrier protein
MPDERAVLEEIRRIARDELGLDVQGLGPETTVASLDLDSITLTTLLVGLEDRFRVCLAPDETAGVERVGQLAGLVSRLAQRPAEAP